MSETPSRTQSPNTTGGGKLHRPRNTPPRADPTAEFSVRRFTVGQREIGQCSVAQAPPNDPNPPSADRGWSDLRVDRRDALRFASRIRTCLTVVAARCVSSSHFAKTSGREEVSGRSSIMVAHVGKRSTPRGHLPDGLAPAWGAGTSVAYRGWLHVMASGRPPCLRHARSLGGGRPWTSGVRGTP